MFIDGLLYAGDNDSLVRVAGLKNGADGSFINNAAITAELRDGSGNLLPGMLWPAAVNYVADSDGTYQLLLDSALNLVDGRYYQLRISVDAGGLNAQWDQSIKATRRS